jgi:hypothetical protein
MTDNYHIKEIRPVIGDWFCVTANREEDLGLSLTFASRPFSRFNRTKAGHS